MFWIIWLFFSLFIFYLYDLYLKNKQHQITREKLKTDPNIALETNDNDLEIYIASRYLRMTNEYFNKLLFLFKAIFSMDIHATQIYPMILTFKNKKNKIIKLMIKYKNYPSKFWNYLEKYKYNKLIYNHLFKNYIKIYVMKYYDYSYYDNNLNQVIYSYI